MKISSLRQRAERLCLSVVLGALVIATSGCAIDGGRLLTDMVEAGLNSAASSIVNALSEQLARD